MAKEERSTVWKVLATAFAAVLLPFTIMGTSANAQQASSDEEDPHTNAAGTMEQTTEVINGTVYTTYVFTSNDLKKKSGYSMMMREEQRQLQEGENLVEGQKDKKVDKDAKIKFILEGEADKLDKYQKKKNNGIPMDAYLQWSVGEPIAPDADVSNAFWNPIVEMLRFIGILQTAEATHVQQWAHRSQAYSPYDPIDLILTDDENASTDVLTAAAQKMNGNGWSQLTCYPSTTLYVLINGVYTGQNANEYKYTGGVCDQYHVRFWRINSDLAIGAAHKEVVDTEYRDIRHIGGLNTWEDHIQPGHRVISFENGETEARNAFSPNSLTCWDVYANFHLMSNSYTREYWNDARTQLINAAVSGQYASELRQVQC